MEHERLGGRYLTGFRRFLGAGNNQWTSSRKWEMCSRLDSEKWVGQARTSQNASQRHRPRRVLGEGGQKWGVSRRWHVSVSRGEGAGGSQKLAQLSGEEGRRTQSSPLTGRGRNGPAHKVLHFYALLQSKGTGAVRSPWLCKAGGRCATSKLLPRQWGEVCPSAGNMWEAPESPPRPTGEGPPAATRPSRREEAAAASNAQPTQTCRGREQSGKCNGTRKRVSLPNNPKETDVWITWQRIQNNHLKETQRSMREHRQLDKIKIKSDTWAECDYQ